MARISVLKSFFCIVLLSFSSSSPVSLFEKFDAAVAKPFREQIRRISPEIGPFNFEEPEKSVDCGTSDALHALYRGTQLPHYIAALIGLKVLKELGFAVKDYVLTDRKAYKKLSEEEKALVAISRAKASLMYDLAVTIGTAFSYFMTTRHRSYKVFFGSDKGRSEQVFYSPQSALIGGGLALAFTALPMMRNIYKIRQLTKKLKKEDPEFFEEQKNSLALGRITWLIRLLVAPYSVLFERLMR